MDDQQRSRLYIRKYYRAEKGRSTSFAERMELSIGYSIQGRNSSLE